MGKGRGRREKHMCVAVTGRGLGRLGDVLDLALQ